MNVSKDSNQSHVLEVEQNNTSGSSIEVCKGREKEETFEGQLTVSATPVGNLKSVNGICRTSKGHHTKSGWTTIFVGAVKRNHLQPSTRRFAAIGILQTAIKEIKRLDNIDVPVLPDSDNHRYRSKHAQECWMTKNMPLDNWTTPSTVQTNSECAMCTERRNLGMSSACFYFSNTSSISIFKVQV
jgi:hypothetical protein